MTEPGIETPPPEESAERSRLDQLLSAQSQCWRQGAGVAVEVFLRDHAELADDPAVMLALIYNEVVQRHKRGEEPVLEEYLQRFPQHADALRLQFEVHGALEASSMLSGLAAPAATVISPFSSKHASATVPSQAVPGYELLGELGRGGMGVVYKARHIRLNRLVALKMVLAGAHAGTSQLARFQIEAEAVASLRHPNIVQVYEVGEHERCPYLALEFVEGGGLDQRLAGKPVPPRDAAVLVEKLARAMHVAHLRGIIHRDLKPGNVLLASGGREPPEDTGSGGSRSPLAGVEPKISDFGLAKRLEAESQTYSGWVLGTPSYMAPEQAAGQVHEVGPHSDVYALGAILYECLTGRPPFHGRSVVETLTLVKTEEVAPPSHRLKGGLPRDLETICLKCLQKSPPRRYPSAEELADDLRRFLNNEPIRARPVGRVECLVMWARRKPAVAGLVGVSLLAVLALVGLGAWSHVKVKAALRRAETNLKRAQRAIDRFYVQFAEQWLEDEARMDQTQERFLREALVHYEQLVQEEFQEPSLLREQGLALMRMGQMYRKLRRTQEAEEAFERALEIQQRLHKLSASDADYREDLANTLNWRGELLRTTSRLDDARASYERAMALQEALAEEFPGRPNYRQALARSHYNRAFARKMGGDPEGARRDLDRAVELLLPVLGERAGEAGPQLDLVRAKLNLGSLLREQGKFDDARSSYRQAISQLTILSREQGNRAEYRLELARLNKNLGNLELHLNNFSQAQEAHDAARKLLDRLVEDFPLRPDYQQEQAEAYNSLGAVAYRKKEYPDAERLWDRAMKLSEDLAGRAPENADYRYAAAQARLNLGAFSELRVRRRPEEAAKLLEVAEQHLRYIVRKNPGNEDYVRALLATLKHLAEADLGRDRPRQAAERAREVAGGDRAQPLDRYQAASLLARCAAAVDRAAGTAEERKQLATSYADEVMRLLRTLEPAQFAKPLLADKDRAFAALESREDFRRLVGEWEVAPRR